MKGFYTNTVLIINSTIALCDDKTKSMLFALLDEIASNQSHVWINDEHLVVIIFSVVFGFLPP